LRDILKIRAESFAILAELQEWPFGMIALMMETPSIIWKKCLALTARQWQVIVLGSSMRATQMVAPR
jgi:hypothetical protein